MAAHAQIKVIHFFIRSTHYDEETTLLRAVTYMGHNDCHQSEPFSAHMNFRVHREESKVQSCLQKTGQVPQTIYQVDLTQTGLQGMLPGGREVREGTFGHAGIINHSKVFCYDCRSLVFFASASPCYCLEKYSSTLDYFSIYVNKKPFKQLAPLHNFPQPFF